MLRSPSFVGRCKRSLVVLNLLLLITLLFSIDLFRNRLDLYLKWNTVRNEHDTKLKTAPLNTSSNVDQNWATTAKTASSNVTHHVISDSRLKHQSTVSRTPRHHFALKTNRIGGLRDRADASRKIRPYRCSSCFRHDFKYVINNDYICKTEIGNSVELFVMILTSIQNQVSRSALRNTWLKYTSNNTASVRYAFLLGKNELPIDEFGTKNFVDTYHNLTYKTIMGFRWATKYCPNAQFVMKVDDDMWVNVPQLVEMIRKEQAFLQTGLVGFCHFHASPFRDIKSKWHISRIMYPNNSFPDFCSGAAYVTSMQVVSGVFRIYRKTSHFFILKMFISVFAYTYSGWQLRLLRVSMLSK